MENAKQLTFSWKVKLGVLAGTILMGFLFARFGKFALARPTFFSIVVIVFAMAIRWELRRKAWFWAVMITAVVLHLLLILCVPWSTRWIPALVMMPVAAADVAGILAIIGLLERHFVREAPKEG